MIELFVRLGIAAVAFGAAFYLKTPSISVAAQLCGWSAAWSTFVYLVERRELRSDLFATVVAVIDSATAGVLLSAFGLGDRFGFVALLPAIWSSRRFGASPLPSVIAASLAVIFGPVIFKVLPTNQVLIHAAIMLSIGLFVGRPRAIVIEREVVVESESAEAPIAHAVVAMDQEANDELKEKYRTLREHTQDLEKRNRRDRIAMHVHEAVLLNKEDPFGVIAKALAEATGCSSVLLFGPIEAGRRLACGGSWGVSRPELHRDIFELGLKQNEAKIKSQIEQALDRWESVFHSQFCGVLLRNQGKIVGLVILADSNVEVLSSGRDRVEDVSDIVATILYQVRERDEQKRRLVEAETLYSLAAVTLGSESRTSVASRTVREFAPILRLDHLSICLVDGNATTTLASDGVPLDVVPQMSFAYGAGVGGWVKTGAPEVVLVDALDDERVPKEIAIKKRVGSLAILPIQFGELPFGYLCAATQRVGGVDSSSLESLRVIASELAQSFGRLESGPEGSFGLMTPNEFKAACAKSAGCLVHLDVQRREELLEAFGRPAVEIAARKFAARARARLVAGGGICRRDQGDFVAFLPAVSEEFARTWANDLIATAATLAVTTPDGRMKIPLAIRAKVATVAAPVATPRVGESGTL